MSPNRKWVAVLAPDADSARRDMQRCAELAGGFGRMSSRHMILDTPEVRFQWVLPNHVEAVQGARFNEWSPIEGYKPGPEAWRMVALLQRSVNLTNGVVT